MGFSRFQFPLLLSLCVVICQIKSLKLIAWLHQCNNSPLAQMGGDLIDCSNLSGFKLFILCTGMRANELAEVSQDL